MVNLLIAVVVLVVVLVIALLGYVAPLGGLRLP